MGFLRRVLGGHDEPATTSGTSRPYRVFGGPDSLEVVGESHYQDALRQLVGPTNAYVRLSVEAVLLAETDNQYDANAISVWISGLHVGYLGRDEAEVLRPGLLALERTAGSAVALPGVIAGGGDGRPSYGVFLSFDATDFGLASPERPTTRAAGRTGEVRTGLSEAIAGDEADDAYDLGWEDRVPLDRLKAMTFLRQQLAGETEPVSRHFVYSRLEDLLYGARDDLPSALSAFDAVCEAHHADMATIRPALVRTFGGVPLLEVYRQAAIRHQKAYDWSTALRWAEAGIAVYGSDALRPDSVDDLVRRTEHYRAKLAPKPTPASRRSNPAASEPAIETLTCTSCGRTFERTRTRGRKPLRCPECVGITAVSQQGAAGD